MLDNVIAPVSLTTAGDIATWTVVGGAIIVMRVGMLVTTAQTGAVPIIRWDWRLTYGSDVDRYNGIVQTFAFPPFPGGVGVGATVWSEARAGIGPGQQVICAVAVPGGAGSVIPFIVYEARPETLVNLPGVRLYHGATIPYTGPHPEIGGPYPRVGVSGQDGPDVMEPEPVGEQEGERRLIERALVGRWPGSVSTEARPEWLMSR